MAISNQQSHVSSATVTGVFALLNRPEAKGRKYFFLIQLIAEIWGNEIWHNLELKACTTITLCKWKNSTKCLSEEVTRFSMWCG